MKLYRQPASLSQFCKLISAILSVPSTTGKVIMGSKTVAGGPEFPSPQPWTHSFLRTIGFSFRNTELSHEFNSVFIGKERKQRRRGKGEK